MFKKEEQSRSGGGGEENCPFGLGSKSHRGGHMGMRRGNILIVSQKSIKGCCTHIIAITLTYQQDVLYFNTFKIGY